MYRQNGFCVGRDGAFQPGWVEQIRTWVGLNQYRHQPRPADAQYRRDVGIGRNDNFAAVRKIPGHQHQHQRIEPVGYTDAVPRTDSLCEGRFKRLNLCPQHIPA